MEVFSTDIHGKKIMFMNNVQAMLPSVRNAFSGNLET